MSPIGKGLEAYLHRQVTEIALNKLAEAREQAANIQAQAQAELERKREQHAKDSEQEDYAEHQRILAQVKLEVLKHKTVAHEQFLGEVWQQVEQELRSVVTAPPSVRARILEDLIVDAAEQLQGGELELQVGAHDMDLVTPELCLRVEQNLASTLGATSLHLNQVAADIWGGVLVYRSNSHVMVDNSFAARFALVQSTLRNQVLRILEADTASV
ncbi:MAG: hypothetical protein LLG44_09985 [Chloroflexi bacterium]|nr:hypothetical protein [Chloroflexota bacterium]